MDFTYREYENLLDLLKKKGYQFSDYANHYRYLKPVILRHDVDFSLIKALEFAELEYNKKVKTTYFILLSTDFYNVFSKNSNSIIEEIKSMGHEIGLHFDETRYVISNEKDMNYYVNKECELLGYAVGDKIRTVSMHRPSKWILDSDVSFDNIMNSYSKMFIKEFKYLSDSRMRWREDISSIVENSIYDKLHILTHPFWYSDKKEIMKEKLLMFINESKIERYKSINDNFRDLNEILTMGEL